MNKTLCKYWAFSMMMALSALMATGVSGQANVLFVGNSYIYTNNLPQMTADVASSAGYRMTWQSNAPGGCTFSQHCTNQSMTMIRNGGWDFVVLQEQSQYPSFPQWQVETGVFPYAARLVDSVYAANPCAEPMFYMTWGRRDGDASNAGEFPVLGTYEGMDSMLYERYMQMAADNDASVCPVGRVWRYLRTNHPSIELYQSDGSHPSVAGTYAAACSFAVMFFGLDPRTVHYCPTAINQQVADTIRQAVYTVVYSQLPQWRRPVPQATVALQGVGGREAVLTAHIANADGLVWHFGDGDSLTTHDSVVTHTYADTGSYTVSVVATRHCMSDTALLTIHIQDSMSVGIVAATQGMTAVVYPNPASDRVEVVVDGCDVTLQDNEVTLLSSDGRSYALQHFADLPSGLYVVRVVHNGHLHVGKVVKR